MPGYVTMKFVFSKKEAMKYISHLDLIRLFNRALRRSGLPVKMTEGFNPHPKLSIQRALKLGVESLEEHAHVVLMHSMLADTFREQLQRQLPPGIEIVRAEPTFA